MSGKGSSRRKGGVTDAARGLPSIVKGTGSKGKDATGEKSRTKSPQRQRRRERQQQPEEAPEGAGGKSPGRRRANPAAALRGENAATYMNSSTFKIAQRAQHRKKNRENQQQKDENEPATAAVNSLPVYYVQTSKEVKAVAERVSYPDTKFTYCPRRPNKCPKLLGFSIIKCRVTPNNQAAERRKEKEKEKESEPEEVVVVEAYVPPSKQTTEVATRATQRRREKEQQKEKEKESEPEAVVVVDSYVPPSKQTAEIALRAAQRRREKEQQQQQQLQQEESEREEVAVVEVYVPPSKQTAEVALRAAQRRREKEQQQIQQEVEENGPTEVAVTDTLPVYYVRTSKEVKAVAERVSYII